MAVCIDCVASMSERHHREIAKRIETTQAYDSIWMEPESSEKLRVAMPNWKRFNAWKDQKIKWLTELNVASEKST